MGAGTVEEADGLSGGSVERAHRVLECTQTHPLWESAPGQQLEGCQMLTGSGESDWNWGESRASDTVPSLTPPPQQHKAAK